MTARVLIVEDDAELARALQRVLRLQGYESDLAPGLEAALAALMARPYQVVLTDLMLEDGDGLELLRWLAPVGHGPAVVVMTGYPTVPTAIAAVRSGAVEYLTKPFTPAAVLDAIRAALDRSAREVSFAPVEPGSADWREWIARLTSTTEPAPKPASRAETDSGADTAVLSERERAVALAVMRGLRPKEIGPQLGISPHTVRNHLKAIYRKLGIHSQVDLANRMAKRG